MSDASPSAAAADGVDSRDFSFAFQPIVDTHARVVYSHEALVRGLNNEPAYQVIKRYSSNQMAAFDAACRAKAIEVAARIGVSTNLNLNFLPTAAFNEAVGLNSTIEAADRHAFPLDRIILEATEGEAIGNHAQFAKVVNEYRRAGMRLAIDDFGAGYSGLNLLSEFQPDIVKLDMALIRDIDTDRVKRTIVRNTLSMLRDLGIEPICEGVETLGEHDVLRDLGVSLMQGYLLARPAVEALPPISWARSIVGIARSA